MDSIRAPLNYYFATAERLGINLDDLVIPHVSNGALLRKTVEEIIASPDPIKGGLPYAIDYLSKPNERGTALGVTEKLFVDKRKLRNLLTRGSNIESTLNLEYAFRIFLSNKLPLVGGFSVIDGQITDVEISVPVALTTRSHPIDVIAQWVNIKQDPKPFFPQDFLQKGADYKKAVEWMLQEYARVK